MRRVIVAMGIGLSLSSFGCVEVISIEDALPPQPQESEQERIARVCRGEAALRCGDVSDEVSGEVVACGQTCSFGQRCLATRCEAALALTLEPDPELSAPLKLPWDVATSQRPADDAAHPEVQVIWASAPPDAPLGAPPLAEGEQPAEDPSGGGVIYSYVISAQGQGSERALATRAPAQARRAGDGFGHAIVSDERWLVVSAPGIDWDESTPINAARSPVYIFRHDAETPGRAVYNGYVEIDAPPGARCGSALALKAGRLVIGCPGGDGVLGSVWAANLVSLASSKLVASQLDAPMADSAREGLGTQVALEGLHTLASAASGAVMWYDGSDPLLIGGEVSGVGFWSSAALGRGVGSGALLYGDALDEICSPVAGVQSCLYCYQLADVNVLGPSLCDFGATPNQRRMHLIGPRASTFLAREDIVVTYSADGGAELHVSWIAREEEALRWRDEVLVRANLPQLPGINDRVRFALNPASLIVSVWSQGDPQARRLLVLGRPGLETPLVGAGGQ